MSKFCFSIFIFSISLFPLTAAGPDLTTENLLASIAAALHMNNQPLIGQNATKAALTKNPGVHINTDQPLVQVGAECFIIIVIWHCANGKPISREHNFHHVTSVIGKTGIWWRGGFTTLGELRKWDFVTSHFHRDHCKTAYLVLWCSIS